MDFTWSKSTRRNKQSTPYSYALYLNPWDNSRLAQIIFALEGQESLGISKDFKAVILRTTVNHLDRMMVVFTHIGAYLSPLVRCGVILFMNGCISGWLLLALAMIEPSFCDGLLDEASKAHCEATLEQRSGYKLCYLPHPQWRTRNKLPPE